MKVTILAGGTGGAKLACGLRDLAGPENLTVIANTGDDIEAYGLHVSPDPDLITYWLAGLIDEKRGWGIAGESFTVYEQFQVLGSPDSWFKLGDLDMATCILRTELMGRGATLTRACAQIAKACGSGARVLPMSNERVATYVKTEGKWRHFQDYLIRQRSSPPLQDWQFRGAAKAQPTAEVLDALAQAGLIVIGPSNPFASIGPMLAIKELRRAIERAAAPVIAVSPLVKGRSLKGPTESFFKARGLRLDNGGLLKAYDGLIDGLISDCGPSNGGGVPVHVTDTAMAGKSGRKRLAREVLKFAAIFV